MGDCVFICYARADEGPVLSLAARPENQRIPVWPDQWNIPKGADWDQTVREALRGCSQFPVVLSASAVASRELWGNYVVFSGAEKHRVPDREPTTVSHSPLLIGSCAAGR